MAELVLLRQSVGSWHPRSANTSLLWAFETSGAQTFLNCCIFSECLFCHSAMTHFFFFSSHRADGDGLPNHMGEGFREGSSGQQPVHTMAWVTLGLYGILSFYGLHSVTGAMFRKIRRCHLL